MTSPQRPRPDADRAQNLSVLAQLRPGYFRDRLNPLLLGTRLTFISEVNRIPAVEAVLPLVPLQHRSILQRCIDHQRQLNWDLQPDQTPWNFLRGPSSYEPGHAEIDNLTSLEYERFFDDLEPPPGLDIDRFFGALEDYLANDFAVLETISLMAIADANRPRQQEASRQGKYIVRRLLHYDDLRMHLHCTSAIIRLRAGWDKILNNLLGLWFGRSTKSNWPERFTSRVHVLRQHLLAHNPVAGNFWKDWEQNASEIAEEGGVRSIRDGELHYWGKRSLETFGKRCGERSLVDLKMLALNEYARLMDIGF